MQHSYIAELGYEKTGIAETVTIRSNALRLAADSFLDAARSEAGNNLTLEQENND